ncbi:MULTISPECIES: helix-turn-helix domain-containing protein [Planktothricoides]|uniref:Helix-turn-helix domain-containing protein n=2 Tax=Planktothricoides raciborskii TaxID=132608 RepID=A0AAU8J7J3_9CYAN|nr:MULTISPECIES: helix-turn-helix domain-containing protein [Planktothricoides]MBD2543430.1 helix-turn-helix domain-containing protein [Planktothricoides raciborskii FACHB-1370]MBD2581729.1 helix-turn-helix domain-containing protein [Planktothricoides raciborskii FACHB-1261]
MLRANSMFGFAPDFLDAFQKPQIPSKSPKPLPGLNQRHPHPQPHNHSLVGDASAKENAIDPPVTKANDSQENYREYLHQIGQQFRDARTALGMSQYQLHYQTLVPIAHIQALETGRIEALPTAVYVRGFIRKIGTALGLDGDRLADSMPEMHLFKTVLGSRCLSPKSGEAKIVLSRMHLYLGYFALLLISSVWLKQQENATQTQLEPPAIPEIQANVSPEKLNSAQP